MLEIASVLCGAALSLRFNVFVLAPAMMAGIAISIVVGLALGSGWTWLLGTAFLVTIGLQLGYAAGVIIQAVTTAPRRNGLPASAEPPTPQIVVAAERPPLRRPFTVVEGGLSADIRTSGMRRPQADRNHGVLAAKIGLGEALRHDWVELRYEPKADPQSLTLRGAEASIWIRHPDWQAALPLAALPLEPEQPSRALFEFALGHVMVDWAAFAESGMSIEPAINVPLVVLKNLEFIRFAHKHLPIDPRFPGLVIEVDATEDLGLVGAVATELCCHDIRLSIDGLTPGCSFWSRCGVPFELRAGVRVVSGCAADGLKQEVCRAIVDIGHRSHARSVAEGVGTTEDFLAIRNLGFDVAQGPLFGRPMPHHAFIHAASLFRPSPHL